MPGHTGDTGPDKEPAGSRRPAEQHTGQQRGQGRLNSQTQLLGGIIMSNGWSLERKQRQAELIKSWRPWEKSTGPRTEKGKQASAQRGHKGGERKLLRALAQVLRKQKRVLEKLSL